jgi:uncharacterized protein (UPF0212 family)
MPIEKVGEGGVIATGEGVRTFELVALKYALKLFEATGIRPNRFTHPLKIANKLCGMKGRQYGKLYAALDVLIAESREKDNKANTDVEVDGGTKWCSTCGGILEVLGELGNRVHYRCTACGAQESVGPP